MTEIEEDDLIIEDEPANIPEIDEDDDFDDEDEDEDEDEEKKKDNKCTKSIHINTPYVSVAVTTEAELDTLNDVLKKAEHIMDKYKHHHLIDGNEKDYK